MQGILLLTLGLFLALSAGSLVLGDGNLMGPVGRWVASAFYAGFGTETLVLSAGLLLLAVRYLCGLRLRPSLRLSSGLIGVGLAAAALLHLIGQWLGRPGRLHGMPLGGALGEYTAEVLIGLVGTAGTLLLAGLGLLLSLLFLTELSVRSGLLASVQGGRRGLAWVRQQIRSLLTRRNAELSLAAAGRAAPPSLRPADGIPAVVADYGDDRDQRPQTGALALLARVSAHAKEQLTGNKGRSKAPPASAKPADPGAPSPASAEPAASTAAGDAANAPLIVQQPRPRRLAPASPAASATPNDAAVPIAAGTSAASTTPSPKNKKNEPENETQEAAPAVAVKAAAEPAALAAPAPAPAIVSAVKAAPRSPFGPALSEPFDEETDPDAVPQVYAKAEAAAPGRGSVPTRREAPPELLGLPQPIPELVGEMPDKTISQSEDTAPIVLPPSESKSASEVAAAAEIAELRLANKTADRAAAQPHYKPLRTSYEPPPLSLFDFEEQKQLEIDRKAMLDLAQRLESTLADYLVKGRVTAIHPGPVVTMYEFVPAPGTKLSKITALSSDLAMALEALRVRIVAPIPGKAAVGIEVPNRARETVFLKEVLADEVFLQAKSKLTMALGKDIAGTPVCVDLAKMPHLLVAGTTGSGKSVSVNGMVCSLLCNASPDDVKMIMIDPKMLELSIYEGIPHLLLPVVTEPKKANLALRWAVEEMERRYELISKAGVRDIGGYNKKVEKQLHDIEQEQLDMFGDSDYDVSDRPRKLPYIVVLIDEFADLMMVAAKEVEVSVARIAQKARAAGIHLILATQRPSVDVITGLIKANFPSRIAFQVASRIDSRTILDHQGAENLLGMGDMLFTDRGQALRRIHGPLITDPEVHRVVEHLKQQGQPIYDMDILKPRLDDEEEMPEEDMADELYDQAVRLVAETRQASISMVQRRLRIGYNRAARMIERMEREGIVSSADGAKGREVLVQNL